MKYLLAVGVWVKPYRSPQLRIWLGDQLIDEICLHDNIENVETFFRPAHFYQTHYTKNDQRKVEIPKKFFMYELDEKDLLDAGLLKLQFLNCKSNYNNGFVSKSDEYRVECIFLAPKIFFFRDRRTFEQDFDDKILKPNNFIHDESDFFQSKSDLDSGSPKHFTMCGWPCPHKNLIDGSRYKDLIEDGYTMGEDLTLIYKIVKNYGIAQFDMDFDDVEFDLPVIQNLQWESKVYEANKKGQGIWPINIRFLSFCYQIRNNKYVHENQ